MLFTLVSYLQHLLYSVQIFATATDTPKRPKKSSRRPVGGGAAAAESEGEGSAEEAKSAAEGEGVVLIAANDTTPNKYPRAKRDRMHSFLMLTHHEWTLSLAVALNAPVDYLSTHEIHNADLNAVY